MTIRLSIAVVLLFINGIVYGQKISVEKNTVTDQVGFFTDEQLAYLTNKLQHFSDQNNLNAVVIVQDTDAKPMLLQGNDIAIAGNDVNSFLYIVLGTKYGNSSVGLRIGVDNTDYNYFPNYTKLKSNFITPNLKGPSRDLAFGIVYMLEEIQLAKARYKEELKHTNPGILQLLQEWSIQLILLSVLFYFGLVYFKKYRSDGDKFSPFIRNSLINNKIVSIFLGVILLGVVLSDREDTISGLYIIYLLIVVTAIPMFSWFIVFGIEALIDYSKLSKNKQTNKELSILQQSTINHPNISSVTLVEIKLWELILTEQLCFNEMEYQDRAGHTRIKTVVLKGPNFRFEESNQENSPFLSPLTTLKKDEIYYKEQYFTKIIKSLGCTEYYKKMHVTKYLVMEKLINTWSWSFELYRLTNLGKQMQSAKKSGIGELQFLTTVLDIDRLKHLYAYQNIPKQSQDSISSSQYQIGDFEEWIDEYLHPKNSRSYGDLDEYQW